MSENYEFCDAPCPTQGMWPMGLDCDAQCDKPLGHAGAHECPHRHRLVMADANGAQHVVIPDWVREEDDDGH